MKIVLTRKRDTNEKDPLIVMIAPPEEYPGPKIVLSFEIGQTVDLNKLVKERKIKMTGEDLGHAIMGDKRYKGLFKVSGATAKTTEVEDDEEEVVAAPKKKKPTPTPKKKVLNKALRDYENKSHEEHDVG